MIDQGILLYFKAPHSFTGEDVVECQLHGSPIVLDLMLRECVLLGARLARPGEFSERAFLNDKMDLIQAEAIADLIDASSQTAARMAVRSLQGDFSTKILVTFLLHWVDKNLLLRHLHFIFVYIHDMNQLILLTSGDMMQRTSSLGNIRATFTQEGENQFGVILEVNSNKFLITMQNIADQIEEFEIIAIKGFIELTNKIILTIKKLVEHLRYRAE